MRGTEFTTGKSILSPDDNYGLNRRCSLRKNDFLSIVFIIEYSGNTYEKNSPAGHKKKPIGSN